MELRELTEIFLKKLGGMTSLNEVVSYTLTTKAQVAESLNKKGHDFDVSLDNISNKSRHLKGNEDINNYHFLVDLERIGHGLQGRWSTDLDNQHYSDELQKRVREITVGMS
jgi:hypothetical protein